MKLNFAARRRPRHGRLAVVSALALLSAAFGLRAARAAPVHNELVVHVYDVGQGSCVLIECPDAAPIIDDCGKIGSGGDPAGAARKMQQRLADYRPADGSPFETVLITHPHVDHYSVLVGKTYGFNPKDVSALYYGGDFSGFSDGAKAWISAVAQNLAHASYSGACDDQALVSCMRPNASAFPWSRVKCGAAQVDLLTVNAFTAQRSDPSVKALQGTPPNGESLIIRVTYAGSTIIIPGDGEEISQHYALANAAAAGASLAHTSLLLSPHHGSKQIGSNNPEWVSGVSPRAVIFSANVGGGYGHPSCAAVDRFEASMGADEMNKAGPVALNCGLNSKTYAPRSLKHQFALTQDTGDVTVQISQAGVAINCERPNGACPAK